MAKASSPWTDERALRRELQKLWDRGFLLTALLAERQGRPSPLPRRLTLKTPSSAQLSERFDEVRRWIAGLRAIEGLRIEERRVRHPVLGQNQVPASAWLDRLDDGAALLGRQRELRQFTELVATTEAALPDLLPWLERYPLKALAAAAHWPQLLAFVQWRLAHPSPGQYLRQVSLPGLDSKLIEQHRAILSMLLDAVLPEAQIDPLATGVRQFERRYGFLSKPTTQRLRVLDPALALLPGADGDITLSAADFAALGEQHAWLGRVERVFITENEINFLAFPPLPGSLVLFGAGYGFEALGGARWLDHPALYYWGDIDTHGFAILDQLRARFPAARSLLMDQTTLLDHRAFWGREQRPELRELSRLSAAEQRLYRDLIAQRFGENLRLEQERVQYAAVLAALGALPACAAADRV